MVMGEGALWGRRLCAGTRAAERIGPRTAFILRRMVYFVRRTGAILRTLLSILRRMRAKHPTSEAKTDQPEPDHAVPPAPSPAPTPRFPHSGHDFPGPSPARS